MRKTCTNAKTNMKQEAKESILGTQIRDYLSAILFEKEGSNQWNTAGNHVSPLKLIKLKK